jgi:flagellar basal-body rod modification protein FlgD
MAITGVTASAGTAQDYINPAEQKAAAASGQSTQTMFLQLLVAQLRNQSPDNPTSGTEFVAQLAQFTQLEQTIAIRQDADSLLEQFAPSTTPTDGSSN